MCGIAGHLAADGEPSDLAAVRRMNEAQRHRSPDAIGTWHDGPVALGHGRLAIIDLREVARQPMTNETDDVVIVVNGEIYNHVALRADLEARGHVFRSRSDSEVVAHLWEEHGAKTPEFLRGMFALAIWDKRTRELLLARDRYGEKPLCWTMGRRGLVFASELRALIASGHVDTALDPAALDAYLALQYVPNPSTIFAGVWKLPPGHLIHVRPGETPKPRPYHTIDHTPKYAGLDEASALKLVRETVEDAVKVRLMSDVPLGAFLSGGIDSSIVVACMARATSRPVKTFSIGFGARDHSELPYARMIAQRYGTDHHEEIVSPDTVSLLPTIVRQYGEPFADPSALPTWVLSEMTKRHVTVALSGDAGDEAFGGYKRYVWSHVAHLIGRLPAPARRGVARLLGVTPTGPGRWVREYGKALEKDEASRYLRFISHFSAAEKHDIYSADLRARFTGDATAERFAQILAASRGGDPLSKLMELDVRTYLPDDILVKVDIASMAHALEVRAPFVDHHVMELAAGLPASRKVRGLTGKTLLKAAFADLIPEAIVKRSKRGFSLPLRRWFADDLLGFARETLLSKRARERGLFDSAKVAGLIDRHTRGEDHGDRIWNLLVLELWHLEVLDQPGAALRASA
ncbi:MAG: asparagine synthase (glutamine-hydrolyzing) [Deltaproteobacteria bacterium]|nr:asparagine synthase (glutamine-hydrolyzing) [Deltaproteobacteria bacterium]